MINIRKTEPQDLDRVIEIFESARAYMRRQGNTEQWADGYPTGDDVLRDMEHGWSYVVTLDGRVVATFCLMSEPEPTYAQPVEGSWPDRRPYLTIHRAASDGTICGILSLIADYQERTMPGFVLRADTHTDNEPTKKALTANGFAPYCTIRLENGTLRTGYERTECGIRQARPEELDEVMQIWWDVNTEVHDYVPRYIWQQSRGLVRDMLARIIEHPTAEQVIYVYHDHGTILGFAGITEVRHIEGIYVRADQRSRGIGCKLIRHIAAEREHPYLEVFRRNERAVSFYQRMGFEVTEYLEGRIMSLPEYRMTMK